jgi:hypothetical protein
MNNFIITTDASQVGIGAVLSQTGADGVERPIFIASRVTTSAESRYAPTALEALAVVHYVEFFKSYVGGSPFKVVTDHRALVWLLSSKRTSMYLRWILRLQQYDFTVEYRPGKYNLVADAVSRSPVPDGSDDLDEPVEPLFLAIALSHHHLLTRTSGLTSCQACLTIPLAPACLCQLLEGRRHTRRAAALAHSVEPNEIVPNQFPKTLHTYLASLQPLLRRLPPEGPIPLSLQDYIAPSAEVRIFRIPHDQPHPARPEPVYKINNTPPFSQMVLTRYRSSRSIPVTEEVPVLGAAAQPRTSTRVPN